jgi:transposase-like protein
LAAAHLDAARVDILAFTAFRREIWRQMWPNNPYLNKEIRKRTDVVGIFPGRDAVIGLVDSVPGRADRRMGPNSAATWKYWPPAAGWPKPKRKRNITSDAEFTIETISR